MQQKLALFAGAEQKDGLQNRANRLANNVSDKLKELQGKEQKITKTSLAQDAKGNNSETSYSLLHL